MEIQDLQLWQTFLTVAQEKNFSRAARALRTTAPNVTKRIAALERGLSTRLFNRTTRIVSLTHEGEALIPAVQQLIDQARDVEARLKDRNEIQGLIRLTCLSGLAQRWLYPLIMEFQAANPSIRFEVIVTDQMVDLIQDQVDLAIRIQEPKGADFVFRELRPNRLVVCASPAYLETAPPLRAPPDLARHRLLALTVHEDLQFKRTGQRLGEFFAQRPIVCEYAPHLTELALLGAGVAVRAHYEVVGLLAEGRLVECLTKHPLEHYLNVYLVIPQKRYLAHRVRAFSDFLMQRRWSSGPR